MALQLDVAQDSARIAAQIPITILTEKGTNQAYILL